MISKQNIKPLKMTYELGSLVLFIAIQIIIGILGRSGYMRGGYIENLFVNNMPTDPINFDILLLVILNTSFIVKGIRKNAPWRSMSSALIVGCLCGAIFGTAFAFSESSPMTHYFMSAILWGGFTAILSCLYVSISCSIYFLIKRIL